MKKGTEAWTEYDANGRWCLKIKKEKGVHQPACRARSPGGRLVNPFVHHDGTVYTTLPAPSSKNA